MRLYFKESHGKDSVLIKEVSRSANETVTETGHNAEITRLWEVQLPWIHLHQSSYIYSLGNETTVKERAEGL